MHLVTTMSSPALLLFLCCLLHSTTAVSLIQTPDNVTGLIGDDVIFRCQFQDSVNQQIIWFHTDSNEVLTRNDILETTDPDKQSRYSISLDDSQWLNLTIRNISYADEGEYKCGYTGNRGDGGTKVFLASAFLDAVTIPASPICNATYESGVQFPSIGDSVSIACSSRGGDPKPVITWLRNNVTASVVSEVDSSSFEISVLEENDRGVTFRCDIDSLPLEDIESCQIIPFPNIPTINIIPNGLVDFGKNVAFHCDVAGDIPLSILSFVTSLTMERFIFNSTGNILTILNFQEDDLQETLTCEVAYNNFNNSFTSIVNFETILPDLNDRGDNDISPNTEDTPTLTIVLIVLAVIVVILVVTALLWYHRKKIPLLNKKAETENP